MKQRILQLLFAAALCSSSAYAQSDRIWLDIGDLHHFYTPPGAVTEGAMRNQGMQWPAILRSSGHLRSEGFWIGVKDWVDPDGQSREYQLWMNGPRSTDSSYTVLEHKLVSKWTPTVVLVNQEPSFLRQTMVDEVNPDLPADRMVVSLIRTPLGIDVQRNIYAFQNEYHDDYHIVERTYTNTGNVDEDSDVELPSQTINEAYFFNIWRWTGRKQAADHGSTAQGWGKFNMVDVVGDGSEVYPVDFTAIYSWAGYDPNFSPGWDHLGSPMLRPQSSSAPSDTIGRLAGMSMQGLVVLHADNSPSDRTYNPDVQPQTLGWIDTDEPLNAPGQPPRDYYELGILTRENPNFVPGGAHRMYPHYADRIEPRGEFWASTRDASQGKQGGHAPTIAYGPYTMAPGERVRVVDALAVGGISYEAATEVGAQYKQSEFDDTMMIYHDANGDGTVQSTPFDYSMVNTGAEMLTKNQWFLTARDSMFMTMQRARALWQASSELTSYPFVDVPAPPRTFEVLGLPDKIELLWSTHAGEADPMEWHVYRTRDYADNLPYERVASMPGSDRGFDDADIIAGVEYYYYVIAVGSLTSQDPDGIAGTPTGVPFTSGRYYTQTYDPVRLGDSERIINGGILLQNAPNPFSESTTITYGVRAPSIVEISIYNSIGQEVAFLLRDYVTIEEPAEIIWDGRDRSGRPVADGIYYCQIRTDTAIDVIPMMVLR